MKFIARIPVTAALLALLLSTTGCNVLKSRDQLTKGVQAFKNARYEEATNHFQNAIALAASCVPMFTALVITSRILATSAR